jgi:hypothetical protein
MLDIKIAEKKSALEREVSGRKIIRKLPFSDNVYFNFFQPENTISCAPSRGKTQYIVVS